MSGVPEPNVAEAAPVEPGLPPEASPLPVATGRAYLWLGTLMLGYVGVYLCRKNLSVAIPMLQETFGSSRQSLGAIASYSTIAYAAGKFMLGPVVDRVGGRAGFLTSCIAVAGFGALGALAPTLAAYGVLYSLNRLAGAAAWPGMVKLTPEWFPNRLLPLAMAWLSMSFVFGGVAATLFAGQLAEWSGNNWRVVMGVPSAVLLLFVLMAAIILPRQARAGPGEVKRTGFDWRQAWDLFRVRRFYVVCALSFTLTLLRETFNTWTVDFFKTAGGPEVSHRIAAFLATPFDGCGALGIIALGWAFSRSGPRSRSALLFLMLTLLAILLYCLRRFAGENLWLVTAAIGLIGFLTYGPYSLLAGILSVEIKGKAYVGTVAGIVDGVGYIAAILAGQQFGRILDTGGYELGFQSLATLALISAFFSVFLYPLRKQH